LSDFRRVTRRNSRLRLGGESVRLRDRAFRRSAEQAGRRRHTRAGARHPRATAEQGPMTRIAIGVHVHAEPERLAATLASIGSDTALEHELLIIPDGADKETAAALHDLDARVLDDAGARGGAACLNVLAASTTAEIVVLLESGAIVAPRWLDRLVSALSGTPRAGLAGPSTNRCWNEQAAFPGRGESPDDVARAGSE